MHSARAQLTYLYLVAISITLIMFGGYDYYRLSHELNSNFALLQNGTVARLTTSLSLPLWDFDADVSTKLIESEMLIPEINAIQVFDASSNLFASTVRDQHGLINSTLDIHGLEGVPVEAEIYLTKKTSDISAPAKRIGRVVAYFSRHRIDELLWENALHTIVELLFIDVLLILVLHLSLRLVFTPLGQLANALNDLSEQGGEYAAELPESRLSEFSEVINGYNKIQGKFNHVIAHLHQAEAATRAEAHKVEQAYDSLKDAQEAMLRSEKLASLGGMVAGVAHEINTPVGITLTSASVLMEATEQLHHEIEAGPMKKSIVLAYIATATESARLILKNAERASHLIYSFKQVASDQTSEQRRKYELGEYIQEVMSSLHPKLRTKQINIKIHCPNPIKLDGFPGAMAQVLTNLTMNAVTHAFAGREQGEIQISAVQAGEAVNMTFIDNGVGISHANIGKIFDLFFTTKRDLGGTGLGLNIVHNILYKKLNGSISVSSEEGKGTCFFMNFPCVIV
jgi:two-component system NtrC family sensor kinase